MFNTQLITLREKMSLLNDKIKNPTKYDAEIYNYILDYFSYAKRMTYTIFSHIHKDLLNGENPLMYRRIKFIPFQFEYDLKIAKDDVNEEMIKNAINDDKNKRKIIDEILSKKTPLEILKKIPNSESFIKMKYKNSNEETTKFILAVINQESPVDKAKVKKLREHLIPCINLTSSDVKLFYHGMDQVIKFLEFYGKNFGLISEEKRAFFTSALYDIQQYDVKYVNNFIWEALNNEIDNKNNQIKYLKIFMQMQIHEGIRCMSPLCYEIHTELAHEILWNLYKRENSSFTQPFRINFSMNEYMQLFSRSENLTNFILHNKHIIDEYGFELENVKNKVYLTLDEMSNDDARLNDFALDDIISRMEKFFDYILYEIKN
jgi:hypothetical protein